MIRTVIIYADEFYEFYNRQDPKVRQKINWTIGLVENLQIIPECYFKHIESTNLYEIRIIFGGNKYRIFCFFDSGSEIIILNGFQKKTRLTPKNEIEKALKLKEQYYEDKNQ